MQFLFIRWIRFVISRYIAKPFANSAQTIGLTNQIVVPFRQQPCPFAISFATLRNQFHLFIPYSNFCLGCEFGCSSFVSSRNFRRTLSNHLETPIEVDGRFIWRLIHWKSIDSRYDKYQGTYIKSIFLKNYSLAFWYDYHFSMMIQSIWFPIWWTICLILILSAIFS